MKTVQIWIRIYTENSVCEFIWTNNIELSDWLTVRNGCDKLNLFSRIRVKITYFCCLPLSFPHAVSSNPVSYFLLEASMKWKCPLTNHLFNLKYFSHFTREKHFLTMKEKDISQRLWTIGNQLSRTPWQVGTRLKLTHCSLVDFSFLIYWKSTICYLRGIRCNFFSIIAASDLGLLFAYVPLLGFSQQQWVKMAAPFG